MPTLARRGSGTPTTTGTTWSSLTNAVDGLPGTTPGTYAIMQSTTSGAVATIDIENYDFASGILSSDTLNSVTVAMRHWQNSTGRFASVRFQPYDGATAIGTIFTATLSSTARIDSTTFPVTLAQLRSATFKIRVTVTGAASTQQRTFSLDHVDVTADYTTPLVVVSGTASLSLSLSMTAVGTAFAPPTIVNGSASIPVSLGLTAVGTRIVTGTANLSLGLNVTASGKVIAYGSGTISLGISLSAVGTVISPVVSGSASLTFGVGLSATGSVISPLVSGTASIPIAFALSATGTAISVSNDVSGMFGDEEFVAMQHESIQVVDWQMGG
jgi:hypothetical protein